MREVITRRNKREEGLTWDKWSKRLLVAIINTPAPSFLITYVYTIVT